MTSERRRAIGFIRKDLSGSRVTWDDRAIVRYADTHGFDLARVLIVPENTPDPTVRLIAAAHEVHADVVIAPSLAHVDRAKRTISEQWDLHVVDTGSTWPRGHRWPGTTFI